MWRIPAVAAAGVADVAADGLEAKWRESMRFVPRRSLARARERSVSVEIGGRAGVFSCAIESEWCACVWVSRSRRT